MAILLEVCVDSPHGLLAAMDGGADRVELCAALALGGLTPSLSLMSTAAMEEMPAVAMIRPRPGDFVWTQEEVDYMLSDIDDALEIGLNGIVIGANHPDGRLDAKVLKALLKDVDPTVEKVLHRAIDLTPDPVEAVETAIALGFDRILTSGGAVRAADGVDKIRAMIDCAKGRIAIMPGSGITPDNVGGLLALLPVDQVHASCAVAVPQNPRAVALGFATESRRETDTYTVLMMREALARID